MIRCVRVETIAVDLPGPIGLPLENGQSLAFIDIR
jgi:hypothetical protein